MERNSLEQPIPPKGTGTHQLSVVIVLFWASERSKVLQAYLPFIYKLLLLFIYCMETLVDWS